MKRLAAWFQSLSRRERRIVTVGVVLVAAALLFEYGYSPLAEYASALRGEIDEKRQLLAKYEEILARRESYLAKASRARTLEAQVESRLLQGTKPELATADLQSQLKNFARDLEISVERVTPKEAHAREQYTEISVELPFHTTADRLRDFLYRVESADRLLYVRNLEIRVPNPASPGNLRVSLEVAGFIHSEAAAAPEEAGGREEA